jgi:hypothetical protein
MGRLCPRSVRVASGGDKILRHWASLRTEGPTLSNLALFFLRMHSHSRRLQPFRQKSARIKSHRAHRSLPDPSQCHVSCQNWQNRPSVAPLRMPEAFVVAFRETFANPFRALKWQSIGKRVRHDDVIAGLLSRHMDLGNRKRGSRGRSQSLRNCRI